MADELENLRCLYERDNTTSGRMIWLLAQERKDLQARVAELTLERDRQYEYHIAHVAKISRGSIGAIQERDAAIAENARLREENGKMREALAKLAAFDDQYAGDILEYRGDYSSFDEPEAVKVAREALAALSTPPAEHGAAEGWKQK